MKGCDTRERLQTEVANLRCFLKKRVRGEFTVEAAVIVPISLYVMVFLLFYTFAEYNATVSYQQAYRAGLWGATMFEMDETIRSKGVLSQYQTEVSGTRIAIEREGKSVAVAGQEVTVNYEFDSANPFPELMEEWLGIRFFHTADRAIVKDVNAVATILNLRAAEGIPTKLQSIEQEGEKK